MSRNLFEAYLRGEADAFFRAHPRDPEARLRSVRRAVRPLSTRVADALEEQNAHFARSPARDLHLQYLRSGSAAVVTGQQVGLFLGPLFTIYKAATAIRTARALAEASGEKVVPIFWLQTEDHDLPEIASCTVPRGGEPEQLCVASSAQDRTSIAHRLLPQEIERCHERLGEILGSLPGAHEHLDRLERAYRPGASWSGAFAEVLAALFAEEGLVLVDPRTPALASEAAPIHHRNLVHADLLSQALLDRSAALDAAGFSSAVHIRPGAPLSFFHPQGIEGPRYRLEAGDGVFLEVGGEGRHTTEELIAALEREPRLFSTSALLRPIVQDSILPTAAYVGGPGEIAYFAQLQPLYEAFDLEMPLIVPRTRMRVVEERTAKLLSRLGVGAGDATLEDDALLAKARQGEPGALDLHGVLLEPFERKLEELSDAIASAGPGLGSALEKTGATVRMAVSKLAEKYEKALLRQDESLVEDVRRLKQALFPGGQPQERVHGLPYYAARHGERAFLQAVLAAAEPFDFSPKDLLP